MKTTLADNRQKNYNDAFVDITPCVRIVVASINLVNEQGAVSNQ